MFLQCFTQTTKYEKKNLIIEKKLFYHENFFFVKWIVTCAWFYPGRMGADLACAVWISSLIEEISHVATVPNLLLKLRSLAEIIMNFNRDVFILMFIDEIRAETIPRVTPVTRIQKKSLRQIMCPLRRAAMVILRTILIITSRWRHLSVNPILQNRYPMVKCLNIGKTIYRSISNYVWCKWILLLW